MNAPKPYPSYRPSGVPWLGDVPVHWEVWRGKAILRPVDVRSETGDEELLTVSAQRGVVPRKSANVTMFKAESYVGYKLCWPGDLVINSLWAWAHGLGVSLHHGIVSSAYGVYRPLPRANARFIHLLVRSVPFQWELQVRSKGIWVSRLQLTDESFLEAPFPIPPLPEQAAIVRYLDHVDRRIRRYVSAKRKLIALLEEEKQAIVNQAVTRGLDPNVRLKPSSVEWLGDVPEHWEMQRLKQISVIQTGITLGKNYSDKELIESPYLRVANVQSGRLDLSSVATVRVPPAEIRRATLRTGDVLMTEGGDIDKLGRGCIWLGNIPGCLHQNHIFAVRTKLTVLAPAFLVAVMGSCHGRIYFEVTAKRTTNLATTNRTTLGNFPMYLPGVIEQQAILDHIADQCGLKDAIIAQARRQIELLQEYRSRLIADVVTGKLDVRDAAAQLPDEADEEGPIDRDGLVLDNMDDGSSDVSKLLEEEQTMEREVTA